MSSIFDIIGPVMIGPSSSHSAGAAKLALMAKYIFGFHIDRADITLYGSFAKTYKGHGTDKALVGGLLGMNADDERIRVSFARASEAGLKYNFIESQEEPEHPNTVMFDLYDTEGHHKSIVGRSLGGGRIEIVRINGLEVEITGDESTILTFHKDRPGIVAKVTKMISDLDVNISSMRVFRKQRYADAVMLIHTDSSVDKDTLSEMEKVNGVTSVMYFEPLSKVVAP